MGFRYRAKKLVRKGYKAAKKRYGGSEGFARLKKDVSMIKGLLNVERKAFDIQVASTAIQPVTVAPNWTIYPLNHIAEGNLNGQRNGASVRIKSLQIKGNIERTAGNHRVRMVVLSDSEPLTSGIGTSPSFIQLYNGTNMNVLRDFDSILQRRFTVLLDRTFRADGIDNVQQPISIYKKLNMVTKWSTQISPTSGASIQNNALYVAFFSEATTAADVVVQFNSRVTYVDN